MSSLDIASSNNARWTEELVKTKYAAKWLAESFGQIDDPFLQLKILEDGMVERHGKRVNLVGNKGEVGDGAVEKPTYSEMVKRNAEGQDEFAFERHSNGVGRRIMEKQGWSCGEGLGNGRKEGRKQAIEARGQVASCKRGVGFKEVRKEVGQ